MIKEIFRELRNLPTLKRGDHDDPYTEQLKHGRIDARIEEAMRRI